MRALAADDDEAQPRGQRHAERRRSSSGAARDSVFCQEKADPKPPCQTREKNCAGDLPCVSRNTPNAASPASERQQGDDDGLGAPGERGEKRAVRPAA